MHVKAELLNEIQYRGKIFVQDTFENFIGGSTSIIVYTVSPFLLSRNDL